MKSTGEVPAAALCKCGHDRLHHLDQAGACVPWDGQYIRPADCPCARFTRAAPAVAEARPDPQCQSVSTVEGGIRARCERLMGHAGQHARQVSKGLTRWWDPDPLADQRCACGVIHMGPSTARLMAMHAIEYPSRAPGADGPHRAEPAPVGPLAPRGVGAPADRPAPLAHETAGPAGAGGGGEGVSADGRDADDGAGIAADVARLLARAGIDAMELSPFFVAKAIIRAVGGGRHPTASQDAQQGQGEAGGSNHVASVPELKAGARRVPGAPGRVWCSSPNGAVHIGHAAAENCMECQPEDALREVCDRCGVAWCLCGDPGYELARLGGEVAAFLADTEPGRHVHGPGVARELLRTAYQATIAATNRPRPRGNS